MPLEHFLPDHHKIASQVDGRYRVFGAMEFLEGISVVKPQRCFQEKYDSHTWVFCEDYAIRYAVYMNTLLRENPFMDLSSKC